MALNVKYSCSSKPISILRATFLKVVMECKIATFLTFWVFFLKCTFLRLQSFISPSIKYTINSVFSVVVCSCKIHVFKEAFFFLKHFSLIIKKCVLPISMATVVKETNFFMKNMQPISPNYPWKNGAKKSAEEKLSQSCILCSIAKDNDSDNRLKIHQKFFLRYLLPFVRYLLSGRDLFNMAYFS